MSERFNSEHLSCSVCTDAFNTTSRGRVECPQCKKDACRACYRRFFTSRFQDPCCMHCHVAFKLEQIHDSFPKSFWSHEYKKHREATLFSLEMSQCAATLPYIERAVAQDAARAALLACRGEIAELTLRLKQKKAEERALLDRVRDTDRNRRLLAKPNSHEHHVPCGTPQCRGFVTKDTPRCACCLKTTCHNCHQNVDDTPHGQETPYPTTGHVCRDDDVATVHELRRNAKQCPECRVHISKVDGCDQMFCVSCHTAFSWNTGERINGPIHNPHYFEVRDRLQQRLGHVAPVAHPPDNRPGCDAFPSIHSVRQAVNGGRERRLDPEVELTFRYALHLRAFACANLRVLGREYSFDTNLEHRVDWMRKKLTDEQFRQHLHRTDKRSRYNAELLSLFQMYSSVVGELYHNMVAERSARAYDDVVKLRAYTMENLHAIKARYSSRDSRYDKYVAL